MYYNTNTFNIHGIVRLSKKSNDRLRSHDIHTVYTVGNFRLDKTFAFILPLLLWVNFLPAFFRAYIILMTIPQKSYSLH